MELSTDQQIFEQINKASKILIVLPASLSADALASGLALKLFLAKMGKEAEVICASPVPENLKFLPGAADVKLDASGGNSLVISVNIESKKLDEISYETSENRVDIFLKPKAEPFLPEDISFSSNKFPLDAIIILDAKNLEDLGKVFEQHPDLFFETPKINIDTKASNEYFGSVNLVDVTATSVSEILASLFEKQENQLIDEDIATCLLTGIITKTHSFQHVQTTPKAFITASELIALGARQQEIIKNIYKTKSLPLLKLWGRALARIKQQDELGLVYSQLSTSDFEKAEADQSFLPAVLKEFVDNTSSYKIIALLCEVSGGVHLLAALHMQMNLEKFSAAFGLENKTVQLNGSQFRIVDVTLANTSMTDAENKFLEAVKGL